MDPARLRNGDAAPPLASQLGCGDQLPDMRVGTARRYFRRCAVHFRLGAQPTSGRSAIVRLARSGQARDVSEFVQSGRAWTAICVGVSAYTAVTTTGIYCQPACSARPRVENVRVFSPNSASAGSGRGDSEGRRDTRQPPPRLRPRSQLGLPPTSAATVNAFARALTDDTARLDRSANLQKLISSLSAIEGVHIWTAHYIALRLGEPDAFPVSDVVLQRALPRRTPNTAASLVDLAERWRPWRALAANAPPAGRPIACRCGRGERHSMSVSTASVSPARRLMKPPRRIRNPSARVARSASVGTFAPLATRWRGHVGW
jgi:hypothetical protein